MQGRLAHLNMSTSQRLSSLPLSPPHPPRLAKVTANPFSDGDDMKLYHHPACLFETFKRARATTKIIEEPGDIEGFQEVTPRFFFFLLNSGVEVKRSNVSLPPLSMFSLRTTTRSP